MKHKCLSALAVALLSAAPGFPQIVLNQVPSRSLGHPNTPTIERLTLYSANPNYVEGRELYQPRGVALDTTVSPPILYVSDYGNNRVLAWKDATGFTNGQKADLVLGQPDLYSTNALGPSTTATTGLSGPTGLAVDSHGNLYVADSGNNRILRFPQPFNQQSQVPDMVIGQSNFSSKAANAPSGALSARGLNLATGGTTPRQAGLAFDASGNLFVTDRGNRRVLGYRASDLASGSSGPAAYVEIGQLSFTEPYPTQLNTSSANSPYVLNQFATPSSLAFDSQGRLYVTDGDVSSGSSTVTGRILVFPKNLLTTGSQAIRAYGVFPTSSPATSQDQLNHVIMADPQSVFVLSDGRVGAVDTWRHRILIFPSVDSWPSDGSAPQATTVIGHNDFSNSNPNDAAVSVLTPQPVINSAYNSFYVPMAAALLPGSGLFVADSYNNRVVLLPNSGSSFGKASLVLGQDRFDTGAVNLVEGREFDFQYVTSSGTSLDAGVAIDKSGSTPRLYVADPYNHRVLGFSDARTVAPGTMADIVIGQADLQTSLCNYPSGDLNAPKASSLCAPTGVLVDSTGNLYVADTGNGRVLRFPKPFENAGLEQADLVLGKRNFTDTVSDPSPTTMKSPYGLAFSGTNGLMVSDVAYNRVLYFRFSSGGTFAAGTDNGKAATIAYGQQRFIDTGSGSSYASLNSPHHVACDTSGRLYVADTGNNRVIVFNDPNSASTTPTGNTGTYAITGLSAPQGVFADVLTGEIWVTNTNAGTILKFPEYSDLILSGGSTRTLSASLNTLALAQDQFGDLFVADASNRVAIYYPAVQKVVNAANFLSSRPLAPGTWASIFPQGIQFGKDTATYSGNSLPTTLADIQVLLNGNPVPLSLVSPNQINIYTPNGAPTSGTADMVVVRVSTGQVLAAGEVQMSTVSPGIFAIDTSGSTRRAAVVNQDGTVNDPSNPVARGSYISIYATGFGYLANAPADGSPAPGADTGLITIPADARIVIGGYFPDEYQVQPGDPADGKFVTYSGLAPGYVGLWQINFKVPMGVTPGSQVTLAIVLNNVGSWDASNKTENFVTTIAVK